MDVPVTLICMIAPLPLFFLYLMAKDIWGKKKRKEKFVQFLRTWKIGSPILRDVEKLIIGLNGFSPWDRPLAIKRVVKMGSHGMDVVIAALDMPYCWTWGRGFVITSQGFAEACGDYYANAHHFLVRILAEVGRSHLEKLRDVLQHPNPNVRLSAMAALGKTKSPSAVELLIPFLDSSDLEERIGAIVALGELRAKSAVVKIIDSLRDSNAGVREMGVRVLMKIDDIRALPALEELARTDQTVIDDRPIYTMKDLAKDAIKLIQKNNPAG
jgi:hypothetical protein